MLTQLKSNPKVLLTLSIALAIVTIASASLVSRSSRQAFVPTDSRAAAFPTPCVDTFTVAQTGSTPTPTPTGSIASPTPTQAGGTNGTLSFSVRFQDVPAAAGPVRTQLPIRLTLRPSAGGDIRFESTASYNSQTGNWGSTITVPAGTFTALVKGPMHLQKNFGQVTITQNQTASHDWTSTPLRAGDIYCGIPPVFGGACSDTVFFDNYVELSDLSKAIQDYSLNVPSSSIADINLDGYVELSDLGRMIINYSLQPGDE